MVKLILYTNNQYYGLNVKKSTLTNLGNTIPALNNIIPQHITRLNDQYHFILDTCNNLHIINFTKTTDLQNNIYHASTANIIKVNVTIFDNNCKVTLFAFDNSTNTFTIETIKFEHFDDPIKRHQSTPSTEYIYNIKGYRRGIKFPIILDGLNDDIHILDYNQSFDHISIPDHKEFINKRTTKEQHNLLYTAIDNKLCVPSKNIFLCHDYLHNEMTIVSSNTCGDNQRIIEYDTSNYITTTHTDGFTFLISSNQIVFVNTWLTKVLKIPIDNNIINNDVITHGITK